MEEELYIRIVDGKPENHPALASNIIQAFGKIDPNLWAPFKRIPARAPAVFEIDDGTLYELVDGYYTDVHRIRNMTEEEKQTKLIQLYENRPHQSWSVNPDTGGYESPIPYPLDGQVYVWDDDTDNWMEYSAYQNKLQQQEEI